jgi:M6 family metalloprotease-like protein
MRTDIARAPSTVRLSLARRAAGYVTTAGGLAALLCSSSAPADAQAIRLDGTLHVVWDEIEQSTHGARTFYLVGPDGQATRLLPGLASADRLASLDRTHIAVAGTLQAGGPALRVTTTALAPGALPNARAAMAPDRWDFVTILCKFADDDMEPFTPGQVEVVHGATYPGMGHFFKELSLIPTTMTGSVITDWYTLPEPRDHYIDGDLADPGALVRDCTAAADADVFFPDYYGINLQFNGPLNHRAGTTTGSVAFGGSWTLTRDGVTRPWGVTWLGSTQQRSFFVVAHEMGHALGWPHSTGGYNVPYDSHWDVMSDGRSFASGYEWLPIHTISHFKRLAGWIPEDRYWTVDDGTSTTALIARSALPSSEGFLMAEVPLSDTTSYTIEARMLAGYDDSLPAEAVVIHRTSRIFASVVDPDRDGDPNDEAAAWLPGETFVDPDQALRVTVESATQEGFVVTISRNTSTLCGLQLSAFPAEGGSAAVTDGLATGACGRSARATAMAKPDWRFVEWRRAGVPVSQFADYRLTVDDSHDLVAHFEESPGCSLAISPDPPTLGTVELVTGTATGACGRVVTVRATPIDDRSFLRWSLDGERQHAPPELTLGVQSPSALAAEFGCVVQVSAEPVGAGFASVAIGAAADACGRDVTVRAVPEDGWAFSRWTEEGEEVSPDPEYALSVVSNRELVAEFSEVCTLSVAASPREIGSVEFVAGIADGPCGRSVTLSATPLSGWLFLGWFEEGSFLGAHPTLTTAVHEDRTIEATFVGAFELATRAVRLLLGEELMLTSAERGLLDREGNGDGGLDFGDVLALFDRLPAAQVRSVTRLMAGVR